MKTDFTVVLISLATSAIVTANPIPRSNYDPTIQIPQSVFDFQEPNILTRSERVLGAGSEFVMANSESNPLAPNPEQTPAYEPSEIPTGGDNQEQEVPRKDSGLPFLSKPDVHDTTHSQPPDIDPSNGELRDFKGWLLDLLSPKGW